MDRDAVRADGSLIGGADSRTDRPVGVAISVIVPVRRDDRLAACLAALRAQDLPAQRFEIIVADNGPDEATRRTALAHDAHYVVATERGSYAARIRGVSEARGDILAFTDADCIVPGRWLSTIADTFTDASCEVAVGPSSAVSASTISRWVQAVDDQRWRAVERTPDTAFCDTRNLAIRRALLARVPFDPGFRNAGDIDLGIRLRREGAAIRFVDAMRIEHAHPESLGAVLRRGIRRGRGVAALDRKHGGAVRGVGDRPLRVMGRDAKAALLEVARRPVIRWFLAGVVAVALVTLLVPLRLLSRVAFAERPGASLFAVFERLSLLMGRATG